MPMVSPCRVMATGVFDSRKLDRFSRNSRIPTLVACMVLPRCVHNDTTTPRTVPLDEQFSRDAKVFGQLLSLGLADAALAVHKVGYLSTRTEHGNKIRLLQPALFHQELNHLTRRLFRNCLL